MLSTILRSSRRMTGACGVGMIDTFDAEAHCDHISRIMANLQPQISGVTTEKPCDGTLFQSALLAPRIDGRCDLSPIRQANPRLVGFTVRRLMMAVRNANRLATMPLVRARVRLPCLSRWADLPDDRRAVDISE